MPGRGPKPADNRRRRNAPKRGDWTPAPGSGWQHGELPQAPDGLLEASLVTWESWFVSWFAAHWSEGDLPGLRVAIRLYDQVERGDYVRAGELRMYCDTYGITPKGQQDRRWKQEDPDAKPKRRTKGSN